MNRTSLGLVLAACLTLSPYSYGVEPEPVPPIDVARQAAELLREIQTLQKEIEQETQSEETVRRQDRILELWDKLQQSAQPKNPPGDPPPPESNGQPPQTPMPSPGESAPPEPKPEESPAPQPRDDANDGERRIENDQPADRSTEQTNLREPVDTTLLQDEERARLMRNVWGNLPEQVRQRLANSSQEKYLPQYESRIRAYFRSLSEENPPR